MDEPCFIGMVNGLSRHHPPSECHSELKLWTQSLISSCSVKTVLLQSHIQSGQKCHILPNPHIKKPPSFIFRGQWVFSRASPDPPSQKFPS